MCLFVAPCCASRGDNTEGTETPRHGDEGGRVGHWRSGGWVRFALVIVMVRVGVVWQGLARVGAGWSDLWARILFWDRALSGIFGHSPFTPALSHGRLRVRAEGRGWRP